jgi:hypothetical protein
LSKLFSEPLFALLGTIFFAGVSGSAALVALAILSGGQAKDPQAIIAILAGLGFSAWMGWHAITSIPFVISLFRKAAQEHRITRKAKIAADPRGAAMRTGLLRLWLVGTVAWIPIGFYLWRQERSFDPAELAAWVAIPPTAVFALGLGVRWAIAGFRPQTRS